MLLSEQIVLLWRQSKRANSKIGKLVLHVGMPGTWVPFHGKSYFTRLPWWSCSWECTSMQGIPVQSLLQEDLTCCGAAEPMHHNYWACALEAVSHKDSAHLPPPLKPRGPREATTVRRPCTTTRTVWVFSSYSPLAATRESPRSNEDPPQPKKLDKS